MDGLVGVVLRRGGRPGALQYPGLTPIYIVSKLIDRAYFLLMPPPQLEGCARQAAVTAHLIALRNKPKVD